MPVCPSCMAKTLTLDTTCKPFNQIFVIPAVLIGNLDYYRFKPFSLTFTLPGGRKVNAKQNLLASFSCTLFNWSGWNLVWCWGKSSLASCYYFSVRCNERRETTAALLLLFFCCFFLNFNVALHLEFYESIWFQLGMMIKTTKLYIWMSVGWPWLSLKVTGVRESKNFCAN